MSARMLSAFVVFCLVAGMFALIAWPRTYGTPPTRSSAAISTTASTGIQSKARVFDLNERDSFTQVGIMGAYDPGSHAFWWRPTSMIGDPSMLERFFERCKFQALGTRLLNFCVRGNEVVVTATSEYAHSLEQGLDEAESQVTTNPVLLMTYHNSRDITFNLRQKAGVDMNTPAGVPPAALRSVRKTPAGWELDVTCGCGNALIALNDNFDFVSLSRH
jgi:hypothetical protein